MTTNSAKPWADDEKDDPNYGRVCVWCRGAVRAGERPEHAECEDRWAECRRPPVGPHMGPRERAAQRQAVKKMGGRT